MGSSVGQQYLLLADISGYTNFVVGVEDAHGVDFSDGIPPGYELLGALLDAVMEGVKPEFTIDKLEGDAVFATAPIDHLDGHGGELLDQLQTVYRSFTMRRTEAQPKEDHICAACSVVGALDLKMVVHRGQVVRQTVGSHSELLGPAVNVAHRLLKNDIQERIGRRPYLFVSDAAATSLGVPDVGLEHSESYADVGTIAGRIVGLGEALTEARP
jgi:class 3 adenylate cyclase